MHVIATAGHVDHGKSTLVRALTGMEPDRWAEERRRGMTIDLGYAWTDLASGATVAFVDVPGHQRFVSNMLAGAGPVPAAMVVVAADEGWRAQTEEHVAALDALGVDHGLVVVSRTDLADPAAALSQSRERLAAGSLAHAEMVTVSATTGDGLPQLRAALDRVVSGMPPADRTGEPRLWVDRVFSIRGAGTVVTGTLSTGRLAVGDEIEISPHGTRAVIRRLQSCNQDCREASATARVAVNVRGVDTDALRRGDALVAPDSTLAATVIDAATTAPVGGGQLTLHIGSAAATVRVRPLGGSASTQVRMTSDRALPLRIGDRGLLRDPGSRRVAAGVTVLDLDPLPLRRRGAAAVRAAELAAVDGVPSADDVVAWRGTVQRATLRQLGIAADATFARTVGGWSVSERQWEAWRDQLDSLAGSARPGLGPSQAELMQRLGLPDVAVLAALLGASDDLEAHRGRVRVRGAASPPLEPSAAAAIGRLEAHLADHPFEALDAEGLRAAGLGASALAAAVATGRLIRVSRDVYLRPDATLLAVDRLRQLPDTFTVSEARTAWQSSRRVAVPLLQHLDASGWTARIDETRRRLVR
jgi:selenocysteine-specific elongation factor